MSRFIISFCLNVCIATGIGSETSEPVVIQEIQGLWIEADGCNCRTLGLFSRSTPVRCYHYFSGIRAVSGYIRFKGEQECGRIDKLTSEIAQGMISSIDAKRNKAGLLLSPLPEVRSLPYAVGMVRNMSATEVTIWDKDPATKNIRSYKDGSAINFTYNYPVTLVPGTRKLICSSYRKFSKTELYIGIDEGRQSYNLATCDSQRYLTIERYLRKP